MLASLTSLGKQNVESLASCLVQYMVHQISPVK